MGGVEREDYKVDSASPRLSNLECWCHPKSRRVMGVGSFREKDKSCFNVMGVLTEEHSGEQTGLQLENWPNVQKGSHCGTRKFWHIL